MNVLAVVSTGSRTGCKVFTRALELPTLKILYQVSEPTGGHTETDETKHTHAFRKFEKHYSSTFLHCYLLFFHLPI